MGVWFWIWCGFILLWYYWDFMQEHIDFTIELDCMVKDALDDYYSGEEPKVYVSPYSKNNATLDNNT